MTFFADRVVNLPTEEFEKRETELLEIIMGDGYLQTHNPVEVKTFLGNLQDKFEDLYDILEKFEEFNSRLTELIEYILDFFDSLPQAINERHVASKTLDEIEDWYESFFEEIYSKMVKQDYSGFRSKNFLEEYNEDCVAFIYFIDDNIDKLFWDTDSPKVMLKKRIFHENIQIWIRNFTKNKDGGTPKSVDIQTINNSLLKRLEWIFYKKERKDGKLVLRESVFDEQNLNIFMSSINIFLTLFSDPKYGVEGRFKN